MRTADTHNRNSRQQPMSTADSDPFRWHGLMVAGMFLATLPALLGVIVLTLPEPPVRAWSVEAASLGVSTDEIIIGEATYLSSCALCHGKDANGVARLGKPLRNSAYVQQHSDEELYTLIATGRLPTDAENTTGVAMPARGAQGLSDHRMHAVVTYLRAIQDPTQPVVSIDDWIVKSAADGQPVAGLVGGTAGVGHDLFVSSCSACHGSSGEGVPGLGKALRDSPFVDSKSDEDLIAFVKAGRPIWDAENTTGLDMPSKGGNPALTDEQLADIVKYIRGIHK